MLAGTRGRYICMKPAQAEPYSICKVELNIYSEEPAKSFEL